MGKMQKCLNLKSRVAFFKGWLGFFIGGKENRIAHESKKNKRLKGRVDNIRNQIFKI